MSTQATVSNETNSRMTDAIETAGKIAAIGIDFGLLKKRLENAVDDAVVEAKRMTKRGGRAMGGVKEDTTHCIKKKPRQSVGYAAGAAFGIGLCVGWFTSRLHPHRDH